MIQRQQGRCDQTWRADGREGWSGKSAIERNHSAWKTKVQTLSDQGVSPTHIAQLSGTQESSKHRELQFAFLKTRAIHAKHAGEHIQ